MLRRYVAWPVTKKRHACSHRVQDRQQQPQSGHWLQKTNARLMALPVIRVGVHGSAEEISKEDSMSLSIAGALPTGEGGLIGGDDFVCNTSETLIAAIEKCLDNGLGTCL